MARPFYFKMMKKLEERKILDTSKSFYVPEGELINFDCDLYNAKRLPSKEEKDRERKIKEFSDDFSLDELEG